MPGRYCGLSFMPALPWKAMEVPPYVPRPQFVMLGGLLQFEHSLWQAVSVWAACAVVLSVPAWLRLARDDVGKQLLAVQLLFDTLSFPIITKMSSVSRFGNTVGGGQNETVFEQNCIRFVDKNIFIISNSVADSSAPRAAC